MSKFHQVIPYIIIGFRRKTSMFRLVFATPVTTSQLTIT